MVKKIALFFMGLAGFCSSLHTYLIIWDLGDTLVEVSIPGMVLEIGLSDCIWYHLFHTKKKNQLQNRIFDVLEEYGGKQNCHPEEKSYHTAHRPLPQIMCDWLSGKIKNPKKLIKNIMVKMRELHGSGYFKNNLEYRILKGAITAMFNPDVLIRNTKILKEALNIVQEIALAGKHQQTILSNWDGISFSHFISSPAGFELSRYFNMENIIISSNFNLIKPQQLIFSHCAALHNATPENCIFIDDQEENIQAALRYGFKAIQIKNHDFKQLRKDLIALDIL